jgi:ankyrin repeat protein
MSSESVVPVCDESLMLRLVGSQHWAARNGHLDVCAWLIKEVGVDSDVPTHDGTTPFQLAVWQEQLHVCDWLLDQGVDVHQVAGAAPPLTPHLTAIAQTPSLARPTVRATLEWSCISTVLLHQHLFPT